MDLNKIIQDKKESKDYITIKMGLNTEMQCFDAIETLGIKKTSLKNSINEMIKNNVDPNSEKMKGLLADAQEIHYIQSTIVNDVCARFEVIHPLIDNKLITPELLQKKQKYWDWYKSLYKKKYGREPEIIDK